MAELVFAEGFVPHQQVVDELCRLLGKACFAVGDLGEGSLLPVAGMVGYVSQYQHRLIHRAQ